MERNPYNSTKPGHLFTGYENLRKRTVQGLQNGKSFAVFGGRRCGKTSLLLKLEQDVAAVSTNEQTLLPRFVDIQGEIPKSGEEFFVSLARAVVQGTDIAIWQPGHTTQPYGEFLSYLRQIAPKLDAVHGAGWVAILLVDELEVAASHLPNDECFHNLRNLLMNSEFTPHFRVVVTGVLGLTDLIKSGSPLNNLEGQSLSHLNVDEARELVRAGFGQSFPKALEARLVELTGCHPWLLQGVLEYLWEDREHLSEDSLSLAVRQFVRSRDGIFKSWARSLDTGGRAVYQKLVTASQQEIRIDAIRALVPSNATVHGTLDALSLHGVIDEPTGDRVRLSGTVFRDWFKQNLPHLELETSRAYAEGRGPEDEFEPSDEKRTTQVFMVYGRDRKFHANVSLFLRALGLVPLEWHRIVEATGKGAPTIFEIIEKGFSMAGAAVVLLTPDDEARLLPHFHEEHDASHEKELTPQPRPNVLFEAGLAMAKFRDKIIFVRAGHVRQFSDISGMHLLDLNNDVAMREHFAKRLEACGLKVGCGNTYWHVAGDLTPTKRPTLSVTSGLTPT